MTNFSTWLIVLFMIMFWLFRGLIAVCTQFSIDVLGIVSYDFNLEVIILFITLVCIILVIKRKILGSLIYLGMYGVYFGEHFIKNILPIIQKNSAISMDMTFNLVIDLVAIILAIFAVIDNLVDRSRRENPIDKKTDWYFKNEKYDEELKARDKREDNNEYKFY